CVCRDTGMCVCVCACVCVCMYLDQSCYWALAFEDKAIKTDPVLPVYCCLPALLINTHCEGRLVYIAFLVVKLTHVFSSHSLSWQERVGCVVVWVVVCACLCVFVG